MPWQVRRNQTRPGPTAKFGMNPHCCGDRSKQRESLKVTGSQGVTIGPILLGAKGVAHVLTPNATVRRVVNMTALAVADAQAER